jgi:hypothetical protein
VLVRYAASAQPPPDRVPQVVHMQRPETLGRRTRIFIFSHCDLLLRRSAREVEVMEVVETDVGGRLR